jgi:hypothetical protein
MKNLKYSYLNVIQQNYGQGWEDVSEYTANSKGSSIEFSDKLSPTGRKESLLSHDLREYKRMGYATRVIFRKGLKSKEN